MFIIPMKMAIELGKNHNSPVDDDDGRYGLWRHHLCRHHLCRRHHHLQVKGELMVVRIYLTNKIMDKRLV